MPPFAVCIIVKNALRTLPLTLDCVHDIASESIVVDTGSTDDTPQVAANHGARVFPYTWTDSFAAARNESLRHATGKWILWLDADEYFDEMNSEKLGALIAQLPDDNVAFVMKQRSPPTRDRKTALLVDHVRLFRNRPEHRWTYRVHEQILPALHRTGARIVFTDIVIEHTGYEDPAVRRQKLDRNLRLLQIDFAEHPDDAFILFNLGWVYGEMGRHAEALPLLQKSLQRTPPGVSIVPQLFTLLIQTHRHLRQWHDALAACRAARARFPDDRDLLFREALLHKDCGNWGGAEAALARILGDGRRPAKLGSATQANAAGDSAQASASLAPHPQPLSPAGRGEQEGGEWLLSTAILGRFSSVDEGLIGFQARHELAEVYRAQGRAGDAEREWRAVVAEQPGFAPAWEALGELCIAQGRWDELHQAVEHLSEGGELTVTGAVLQARACLARREFEPAWRLLESCIAREPRAVVPLVLLSHALLQDGRDMAAAEQSLKAVLALDRRQGETWINLVRLLAGLKRLAEASQACRAGMEQCPREVGLHLMHGLLMFELDDLPLAEVSLLRVLEMPGAHLQEIVTARHHLGLLYRKVGRDVDAESQWRGALADVPYFVADWRELGELYRGQGRMAECEAARKAESVSDRRT